MDESSKFSKVFGRAFGRAFGKAFGDAFEQVRSNPLLRPSKAAKLIILSFLTLSAGCRGAAGNPPLEDGIATRLQQWLNEPKPPVKDSLFPLEIESELQIALERYAKTVDMPGAVVAIASAEQTWVSATGSANQAKNTAMQPDDRFRVGNISEIFISIICLQLKQEGILDLNDKITDWLPAKITDRIPNSDWITVRQLLNHTSGLPDLDPTTFRQSVATNPSHRWKTQELLELMLDREAAAPRGLFSYSTANYLLLQLIVERATGSSLAEALQTRIVKPLGLKNTFVEFSSQKPLAHGYQDWNQDGSPEDVSEPLLNTGLGLGSNAVVSNAPDLARFLQALFLTDKLIDSSSREKMMGLVDSNSGGYGLGILHTMTRWGEVWGQFSKTTGFSSTLLYLPVHDLVIVSWTNSVDPRKNQAIELAEESLNVVLVNPYRISNRSPIQW